MYSQYKKVSVCILKLLTVKCFITDRKSRTTVDNVVGERRKQEILDIFNDAEHLFRALTTGGHSTVEFPPSWPSETWMTEIFGN